MRKIVVGLVEPVKIKGTRDEVVVLGKFDKSLKYYKPKTICNISSLLL